MYRSVEKQKQTPKRLKNKNFTRCSQLLGPKLTRHENDVVQRRRGPTRKRRRALRGTCFQVLHPILVVRNRHVAPSHLYLALASTLERHEMMCQEDPWHYEIGQHIGKPDCLDMKIGTVRLLGAFETHASHGSHESVPTLEGLRCTCTCAVDYRCAPPFPPHSPRPMGRSRAGARQRLEFRRALALRLVKPTLPLRRSKVET